MRIEGTQTNPDGSVVSVTGGDSCHVRGSFGPILEVPSWWETVAVPMWLPGSSADGALKDAVAGHVAVQGSPGRKNDLTHNTLVYFADWRAARPLDPLERALAAMTRKKVSLVLVVVVPADAFDRPRRDVEAKLNPFAESASVPLLLTEDHEGGWTRTFGAPTTPSAYWSTPGASSSGSTKAPWTSGAGRRPGQTSRTGARATLPSPASCRGARRSRSGRLFEDDRGQRSRSTGSAAERSSSTSGNPGPRRVSRSSAACRSCKARGGDRAPLVVALHGGKEGSVLDQIRTQYRLPFPLVQDTDQRIARIYGVRCWPTTISIDANGLVTRVQIGLTHEHHRAASS